MCLEVGSTPAAVSVWTMDTRCCALSALVKLDSLTPEEVWRSNAWALMRQAVERLNLWITRHPTSSTFSLHRLQERRIMSSSNSATDAGSKQLSQSPPSSTSHVSPAAFSDDENGVLLSEGEDYGENDSALYAGYGDEPNLDDYEGAAGGSGQGSSPVGHEPWDINRGQCSMI